MQRAIHGRVALSLLSFYDQRQGAEVAGHQPIELVLGPADCSCVSCGGEPSRLTMVLNVMSESPVADRCGISTVSSSSSESSITLRFVMSGDSPILTKSGHALFGEPNVVAASRCELAAETRPSYNTRDHVSPVIDFRY